MIKKVEERRVAIKHSFEMRGPMKWKHWVTEKAMEHNVSVPTIWRDITFIRKNKL